MMIVFSSFDFLQFGVVIYHFFTLCVSQPSFIKKGWLLQMLLALLVLLSTVKALLVTVAVCVSWSLTRCCKNNVLYFKLTILLVENKKGEKSMSTIASISTAPRNWRNRNYKNEWERQFYYLR